MGIMIIIMKFMMILSDYALSVTLACPVFLCSGLSVNAIWLPQFVRISDQAGTLCPPCPPTPADNRKIR